MKINRLFEIVYILMNQEIVSAKELAERFEVSTRTIYRDVDILSSAGIPIFMSKGKGGGISLLPDFVLNKTVLTQTEKNDILAALQSLNAVDANSVESTLAKLGVLFGEHNTSFIEIDYSDWGSMIKAQFEIAKHAILSRKILTFDYVSSKGEVTKRSVEPYVLWFKEKTWYLKCFCLDKQQFRVFRLSRMRNVSCLEETYIPKKLAQQAETEKQPYKQEATTIIAKIDASQKYRVLDDFLEKDVTQNEDGSYTVAMNFIEDEWVYGYILSFGNMITVLEPKRVQEIIKQRLKESLERYL